MRKKIIFLMLVLFTLVSAGCLGQNSDLQSNALRSSAPEKVTRAELLNLIDGGGDVLLIDVRTESEYKQGHLPGAIVIPYDEFDSRYTEILDFKDKEVVLYCHVGGMGDYAGSVLLKHGFTNVKNLDGGINGWIKSGGKIV